MANPANFTINRPARNSAINQPAAQTVDTNGTVPVLVDGSTDRLLIELINGSANALTVRVLNGVNPPAIAASGDLTVAMAGSGGDGTRNRILGPFESGRFIQADGRLLISFQAATGSPNCAVRVYSLPKT